MTQPFPPQGTTTNHHHFTKDLLSMDGPTMSSLFQPSAKRPRIEEVELSNNVFDDAFPLSNGHSGGGHGGGGGGGLRLSNPWLLSQMRRASLSAFVDTQAMSNMMFSGSSSSKFGGGGGSNINTMLVPTLDGPADRDEIFKTGDSVIFGNVGLGMGMNGIDSESNQLYGGHNNGSSSRLLSYMDEVVGEDSSNNNKDASMSSLGHLQQQHQQHQQQQQQQYLPTAYASNKRSATAAGLDAQKHLPFMPMQATTTNEPSSVDIGMKMGGPTMMMATAPGPASGSSFSARKDEHLAVSADGSSNVRFRSHQAENWTEKYETLLDYRLKNGHCLVPNQYAENPPLAEWVKRQRYQVSLTMM
jgi:Helicase associated domain